MRDNEWIFPLVVALMLTLIAAKVVDLSHRIEAQERWTISHIQHHINELEKAKKQ